MDRREQDGGMDVDVNERDNQNKTLIIIKMEQSIWLLFALFKELPHTM